MKHVLLNLSLVALGAQGICLAATAVEADKLVMAYEATAVDVVPVPLPSACAVNIASVTDQRNNMESISADRSLPSQGAVTWVKSGLDNLKVYGYRVQQNPTPMPDAVNVDVQLIRSYTWFGNMRINGTVAMDVGITPVGGARQVQKFRALGSKTNVWGAPSEHLTTLNYAFNNLSSKLAVALQSACAGAKTAAN
jgi:hypothetical protein